MIWKVFNSHHLIKFERENFIIYLFIYNIYEVKFHFHVPRVTCKFLIGQCNLLGKIGDKIFDARWLIGREATVGVTKLKFVVYSFACFCASAVVFAFKPLCFHFVPYFFHVNDACLSGGWPWGLLEEGYPKPTP